MDKFVYYTLDIRFYLSLSVNLTAHIWNFADLRQLQIPKAQTKYHEILLAHTRTPPNTTCKIANRYFELKYHFLTLQKIPITYEQGCISTLGQNGGKMQFLSELFDFAYFHSLKTISLIF